MKNLIKFVFRLFLIFLGIIILSLYLWNRYIRERLPREIPMNLSTLGIIVLIYISLIYAVLIILLITQYETKNDLLKNIVNIIYKPLKILDQTLKKNVIVKFYYTKIQKFILTVIHRFIVPKVVNPYLKIVITFEILPRVFIGSTLALDVFYFHELHYIYNVVYISIVILVAKYLKYSFAYAKEQYILFLEEITDGILTNHTYPEDDPLFLYERSVREFIDIQTDAIVLGESTYTYSPITSDKHSLAFRKRNNLPLTTKEYQLTLNELKLLHKDFYDVMEIAVPLSVYLEEYRYAENYSRLRYTKVVIFSLYLICWLYILIISLDITNYPTIMEFLKIFKDISEPFSELFL